VAEQRYQAIQAVVARGRAVTEVAGEWRVSRQGLPRLQYPGARHELAGRAVTEVAIPSPRGRLPGYLATPSVPGPWPGVVVVFDAGGMTQDTRNQADWLAGQGYLALAPDLYRAGSRLRGVGRVLGDMLARRGRSFRDLDASRAWLGRSDGCTGRVGVIGFCMGGGLAMALAVGHGFAAASVNYGGPPPRHAERSMAAACPIVASYGGRDHSQRNAAARLERALTACGVAHDVKEYPDAGHSFLNDHEGAGDRMPWTPAFLERWIGYGYHQTSAQDARRRIIAFFDRHLKT